MQRVVDLVLVKPGRRGELARKDRGSRGRAIGARCVSIPEVEAAGRKAIEVRCDGIDLRIQNANPIVHVVDRHEQDVRAVLSGAKVNRSNTGGEENECSFEQRH